MAYRNPKADLTGGRKSLPLKPIATSEAYRYRGRRTK